MNIQQIEDYKKLRNSLVEMLKLVQSQLKKAEFALLKTDKEIAEEIIHNEARVNGMELSIDRLCEDVLALYTPVASDLRFVFSTIKNVISTERIGDHAHGLAKFVRDIEGDFDPVLMEALGISEAFTVAGEMLSYVIESMINSDTTLARKVFSMDKRIDKINKKAAKNFDEYFKNKKDNVIQALYLYRTIGKLERVGDLVKNVAEEIVFYEEAEVLKHTKQAKGK